MNIITINSTNTSVTITCEITKGVENYTKHVLNCSFIKKLMEICLMNLMNFIEI